jgi:hypothetical protein
MQPIRPFHLFVKAIILFAVANLLFALVNPPVQKLSLYNSIFPGRLRFPFGGGISSYDLTIDELDAIFAAHIISAEPKPADEFRIIVLGDSSIWGELLSAQETLAEQLDSAGLTCGGQKIRVYNLGYPHPFALKDLIILQRAMQYQPDAILWPITLNTLRTKTPNPFLLTNGEQTIAIIEKYNLDYDIALLQKPEPTLLQKTIVGQRNRLARLFLSQWFGFYWAAGVEPTSHHSKLPPIANDLDDSIAIGGLEPPIRIRTVMLPELLNAGHAIAGDMPILLVNEPIFVATGKNSDLRYNSFYPRWAYDEYMQIINQLAQDNHWHYLNLWNALPNELFLDTPLHLSAAGEAQLARLIIPTLLETVCPSE